MGRKLRIGQVNLNLNNISKLLICGQLLMCRRFRYRRRQHYLNLEKSHILLMYSELRKWLKFRCCLRRLSEFGQCHFPDGHEQAQQMEDLSGKENGRSCAPVQIPQCDSHPSEPESCAAQSGRLDVRGVRRNERDFVLETGCLRKKDGRFCAAVLVLTYLSCTGLLVSGDPE